MWSRDVTAPRLAALPPQVLIVILDYLFRGRSIGGKSVSEGPRILADLRPTEYQRLVPSARASEGLTRRQVSCPVGIQRMLHFANAALSVPETITTETKGTLSSGSGVVQQKTVFIGASVAWDVDL